MQKVVFSIIAIFFSTNVLSIADIVASCSGSYQERVKCHNETEKKIIHSHPELLQRNGGELILMPIKTGNPPKKLVNKDLEYTVVAHYNDQQISLIKVTGWEYFNAYIYHHLYGVYLEVFDSVNFSENDEYMVAYNEDIEAGFSPNAVAVFQLGHWPEILSSFHNLEFGVTGAEFISNDEILIKTIFFNETGKNDYGHGECMLKRYGSIWQFVKLNCTDLIK